MNEKSNESVSGEDANPYEEAFISAIKSVSDELQLHFEVVIFGDSRQIRIYFWEHSPMWVRIDLEPSNNSALLIGVVRTYEVPHERTDYNELISIIWASYLRASNTASVRILDIPHPVLPKELLGRYLVFDKQPAASYITLDAPDIEAIKKILAESLMAAWGYSILYKSSGGCSEQEICDDYEEWAASVCDLARWKRKQEYEIGNERRFPNWSYFRRLDRGASLFDLECNPNLLVTPNDPKPEEIIVEAKNGLLIVTGSLKNHIPKKTISQLRRLIRIYGNNFSKFDSLHLAHNLSILPTESHLICLTASGIIALDYEGGHEAFLQEKSQLLERHQKEAILLHSSVQFSWNDKLLDDRFEALALELLKCEPGVRRARQIGSSRASDGGRDLIVDWLLPPSPWETSTDKEALLLKRIIVQCKAHKSSINRTKTGDVVGTVDQYDADGYLLIAFPQVTPQLIDYLEKVPLQRYVWADWWTPVDIEDRLRKNLDVASRFQDLVTVVPET